MAVALASGSSNGVKFSIGNTYERLSSRNAPLDRTGRHRKIHDWTIYLDIYVGDPDIVESVSFDMNNSTFFPQKFISKTPIKIESRNTSTRWRFSSRQTTYGMIGPILISIRGRGGSVKNVSYDLVFGSMPRIAVLQDFTETRRFRNFIPNKMINNKFGIELELSSSHTYTPQSIVDYIKSRTQMDVNLITNYSQGRSTSDKWKIVPDSSIQCSINDPDCNKFELVSPILLGSEGLQNCHRILEQGLGSLSAIKVNKSMGFHVHINVRNKTLDDFKKICCNFIKYEEVMDTFMPPSRQNNSFCQSNKLAVLQQGATNKSRHNRIMACRSVDELCDVMNPQGRYYKLNLQNMKTGRQQTIEFRQHSATSEYKKSSNWVRFCMAFVMNSCKYRAPTPLRDGTGVRDQFEKLFCYVIKDRFLRDYYAQRQENFNGEGCNTCCDDCTDGNPCASSGNTRRGVSLESSRRKRPRYPDCF